MSRDKIKITGSFVLRKIRKKDGKVLLVRRGKNIVTTVGLQEVAELLADVVTNTPTHIAIGDGSTDPSVGETVLAGTERDRQTLTKSQAGSQVTYKSTTLGAGLAGSVTIREAGIFNAAAAGDMYARFLTGDIPMDTDERIEIDWTLTIT